MNAPPKILLAFEKWAKADVLKLFPNADIGIENQDIENVAWCNVHTVKFISGIKIWDTGDYYLEILTMDKEEPLVAVFDKISEEIPFSETFAGFIAQLESLEGGV